MQWNPVIKTFTEHWKSITAQKDATNPEVPNILKNLHIMKWTEALSDFAHGVIGTQTIPLSYVIRETVAVPAAAPPLMTNQPYAEVFGSLEEELIDRATHTHPLYRTSFERSQLRKFQLPCGELDYSFDFSPLGRGGGGMLRLLQN